MAGSYRHVTREDGTYRGMELIEKLGDASEVVEEMWDMIQALAGGDRYRIYVAHVAHLRRRYEHHADLRATSEGYKKFWSDK